MGNDDAKERRIVVEAYKKHDQLNQDTAANILCTPQPTFSVKCRDHDEEWLSRRVEFNREELYKHVGTKFTKSEAADILGISQGRVSQEMNE